MLSGVSAYVYVHDLHGATHCAAAGGWSISLYQRSFIGDVCLFVMSAVHNNNTWYILHKESDLSYIVMHYTEQFMMFST